jgi:hypothetical protein
MESGKRKKKVGVSFDFFCLMRSILGRGRNFELLLF